MYKGEIKYGTLCELFSITDIPENGPQMRTSLDTSRVASCAFVLQREVHKIVCPIPNAGEQAVLAKLPREIGVLPFVRGMRKAGAKSEMEPANKR
jgi:hypothetical protein